MERSRCVICGEKRKRDFLVKFGKLWVCRVPTSRYGFTNFMKINGADSIIYVHPCQQKFLENSANKIESMIKSHNDILLERHLTRTFQLQLNCPFWADNISLVKK